MGQFHKLTKCFKHAKPKWGKNSLKLTEAARNSKVFLSEDITFEQIRNPSIWHTRYWRVLVQELPYSSLRQQHNNIGSIGQKTIRCWSSVISERLIISLYQAQWYTERQLRCYKILYFIPLAEQMRDHF